MKNFKRILLFLLFLGVLSANACSSKYPNSITNNSTNGPTPVVVRILDLDAISKTLTSAKSPTNTPVIVGTQQATPSPTQILPTQTQSPTETGIAIPSGCTNQAKFIKNLNVNDNARIEGGNSFVKIWRIENVGTCTWSTSYSLVFAGGETMGGTLSTPISQEVKSDETVDIRLGLIAPLYAQPYTGNWMLQDAAGNLFGVGDQFDQPLSVIIVVKPLVTPLHT